MRMSRRMALRGTLRRKGLKKVAAVTQLPVDFYENCAVSNGDYILIAGAHDGRTNVPAYDESLVRNSTVFLLSGRNR